MKEWKWTIEPVGGPWTFPPQYIIDQYMNGFFIFRLFIGWMR